MFFHVSGHNVWQIIWRKSGGSAGRKRRKLMVETSTADVTSRVETAGQPDEPCQGMSRRPRNLFSHQKRQSIILGYWQEQPWLVPSLPKMSTPALRLRRVGQVRTTEVLPRGSCPNRSSR